MLTLRDARRRLHRVRPRRGPWSSAAQQPPGYSFPVRIAIARCSVDYTGRLPARLILIKADGSVLIHPDTGTKALNWMPAGSRVTSASVQEFGSGGGPANCLGSGVIRQDDRMCVLHRRSDSGARNSLR